MFDLAACPNAYVGGDVVEMLHYASLYEKGLPPVAGGVLDQSIWFTQACEFLWAERAHLKAALGHF